MEEINHFAHTHPLRLINSNTIVGARFDDGDGVGDEKGICCHVCEKSISSGHAYGCIECHYFLHKACAELPRTINHPSLYHQPLTLELSRTPTSRSVYCNVCRRKEKSWVFFYVFATFIKEVNYTILDFVACIDCSVVEITRQKEDDAIKEEARIKVEHEAHPQHTLTLQLRPGSFRCDACNTNNEGLFYGCDNGDFWIHKTCASLAPTIHLPHHPNHHLVLVYSLPEKFFKFIYYCEFCNIYIRRNVWLYHCANCRYFVHITCALNAQKLPSTPRDQGPSTSIADENIKDLLHFPMSFAFRDPLKLLHSQTTTLHDNEIVEINHWSHRHPLILKEVHESNNMCGIGCSDLINVCQGCVRPLSLPYDSCNYGCSFTLHRYCANLPLKLEHGLHPKHSLHLVNTWQGGTIYNCIGCYSRCNTFLYKFETCNFCLDVNCAFLPKTIKHESHKHPLIQLIDTDPSCNACNKWSRGIS